MNRTYEDMSKHELTRLVVRLTKQHDEWSAEAKRLREGIKEQMQFALDCVGSDIGDLYETIADDLRRLIE